MHKQVEEFGRTFELNKSARSRLELACEEVFVHMVGKSEKHSTSVDILFRLRHAKRNIFVDVRCGTRVDDISVDLDNSGLPKDLEAFKESDVKSIGLMLLGHIAKNIEHIHIDNFAFISFEITHRKSDA